MAGASLLRMRLVCASERKGSETNKQIRGFNKTPRILLIGVDLPFIPLTYSAMNHFWVSYCSICDTAHSCAADVVDLFINC